MSEMILSDFWDHVPDLLDRARHGGILCTMDGNEDTHGRPNALTLGWCLLGPHYGTDPIIAIAVSPRRFSWQLLEETNDFCIAIPTELMGEALRICGTHSGRNEDKFQSANLTPVPGIHCAAPAILECPVNIECTIYNRIRPPHGFLAEPFNSWPLEEQHTIYLARVIATYIHGS